MLIALGLALGVGLAGAELVSKLSPKLSAVGRPDHGVGHAGWRQAVRPRRVRRHRLPPGRGKSTLLQILGGLDRPSSGTVDFDGRDLAQLRDPDSGGRCHTRHDPASG